MTMETKTPRQHAEYLIEMGITSDILLEILIDMDKQSRKQRKAMAARYIAECGPDVLHEVAKYILADEKRFKGVIHKDTRLMLEQVWDILPEDLQRSYTELGVMGEDD